MEPCAHHGTTPPCVDAVLAAGIARVVAGLARPESRGRRRAGAAARPQGSRSSSPTASRRGARTRPGAPGSSRGGRSSPTRPRSRSTAASPCPARAGSRARSPAGSCTSCARPPTRSRSAWAPSGSRTPRLDARDVDATRQPRRLAFGTGPLPEGSELELRSGAARGGARALCGRGRPVAPARGRADARRAPSSRAGLVDKLLLFVAPTLSGAGPGSPTGSTRRSRSPA